MTAFSYQVQRHKSRIFMGLGVEKAVYPHVRQRCSHHHQVFFFVLEE
jgi:hypothetical protein